MTAAEVAIANAIMAAIEIDDDALAEMSTVEAIQTAFAARFLAAMRGSGFAVVPREATSAMTLEANKRVAICTPDGTWSIGRDEAGRTWRIMVAAAESPK